MSACLVELILLSLSLLCVVVVGEIDVGFDTTCVREARKCIPPSRSHHAGRTRLSDVVYWSISSLSLCVERIWNRLLAHLQYRRVALIRRHCRCIRRTNPRPSSISIHRHHSELCVHGPSWSAAESNLHCTTNTKKSFWHIEIDSIAGQQKEYITVYCIYLSLSLYIDRYRA